MNHSNIGHSGHIKISDTDFRSERMWLISLKTYNQFEKVYTILNVITALANSHPKKLVNIDDLCKEYENQGIDSEITMSIVSKLKTQGDVITINSKSIKMNTYSLFWQC